MAKPRASVFKIIYPLTLGTFGSIYCHSRTNVAFWVPHTSLTQGLNEGLLIELVHCQEERDKNKQKDSRERSYLQQLSSRYKSGFWSIFYVTFYKHLFHS